MLGGNFRRVCQGVGVRLGDTVGLGRGAEHRQTPWIRRRHVRRRALAVGAIVAFAAIAAGGYAIGASQGVESGAAVEVGRTAGELRGAAVGAREGYASAFKPARERAYEAAYRESYRTAYRQAFDEAGLAVPNHVPGERTMNSHAPRTAVNFVRRYRTWRPDRRLAVALLACFVAAEMGVSGYVIGTSSGDVEAPTAGAIQREAFQNRSSRRARTRLQMRGGWEGERGTARASKPESGPGLNSARARVRRPSSERRRRSPNSWRSRPRRRRPRGERPGEKPVEPRLRLRRPQPHPPRPWRNPCAGNPCARGPCAGPCRALLRLSRTPVLSGVDYPERGSSFSSVRMKWTPCAFTRKRYERPTSCRTRPRPLSW